MSYSDYDKFKDKKKKKIYFNKEDAAKQPVILAKPEGDKSQSDASTSKFILKTRDVDSRAVSPSNSKPPIVLRKENEVPAPTYQLASKPPPPEAPPSSTPLAPRMYSCVKLVDDSLQMCEGISDLLLDQNDFTVVGILGEQGCGKSFIMSSLAGKLDVFKSQCVDVCEGSVQCTYGIDMFVTPSRMILLDVQPVLSSTSAERCLLQDKKYTGEFTPPSETSADIVSMQLVAFLLSVCHVVLIVQDWTGESEFVKSLMDAEMLKPSTTTTSSDDQLVEYFPHVVFIKNRASSSDFTVQEVDRIQDFLRLLMNGSQLHMDSGLSIATGHVMSHLSPSACRNSLNMYLLPDVHGNEHPDQFKGHPGFDELVRNLRLQILSAPHQHLTHTPISEKHWLHYASKTLDNVKKSSLFMEFARFLP